MDANIDSDTTLLTTTLHTFRMSDSEDPYLYAAEPLWQWQQSESGSWAMANCAEVPIFYCQPDHMGMGYIVTIVGKLNAEQLTFWNLKYRAD